MIPETFDQWILLAGAITSFIAAVTGLMSLHILRRQGSRSDPTIGVVSVLPNGTHANSWKIILDVVNTEPVAFEIVAAEPLRPRSFKVHMQTIDRHLVKGNERYHLIVFLFSADAQESSRFSIRFRFRWIDQHAKTKAIAVKATVPNQIDTKRS